MLPVAVIILNWNGEKLLREFLPSVIANTNPSLARVIVADNGSSDSSLQVLRSEFPDVEIFGLSNNYGFAGGYNRCLEHYRDYPYAVLLNSDVAPRAGWVDSLLDYMENHKAVAACQPKILSHLHPGLFEYAGAAGGFIDRNGYPYCRGRIFDIVETDHGQYDTPIPVFWATGAALMVRTRAFLNVGSLDEAFFAHMEEIDLCWRLWLAGHEVAVVPQAVVEHLGGASLPKSNPEKTYLNFRNNLLRMHKNLPPSSRGLHIFRRMLLDGIAWLKFAITGHFADAAAIRRAHRDFRRMRPLCNSISDGPDMLASRPNILLHHYFHLPASNLYSFQVPEK